MSEIDKIAETLRKKGIGCRERVAVLSENSPGYAMLVMACWKIGAVVAPISTRYPVRRINAVLDDIGCDKVFVSADHTSQALKACTYRISDLIESEQREITPAGLETMNLDLNADASIIFTSASSGSPKAVLHSIANHYYSAAGACKNMPFGEGDRWLMSLPMYHISGFSLLMRALLNRGTIVFPSPAESLHESVLKRRLTHISLVPAQLSGLMNEPACLAALKKLNAILVGGSSVPASLVEKAMAEKLPIYTTYGSTEMASQITTAKPQDLEKNKHTSGRILDHRQLKIAPDGEILVKGKTLFRGYLTGGAISPAIDQDGYFHSSDIGYIDDGNLFVSGRKDLMFVSGGENIFPEEIERALEDIEYVDRAIVVPVHDHVFGQRPAAFVKTRTAKPLDSDVIVTKLRNELERFKIPAAFFSWPNQAYSSLKPNRKAFSDLAARLMSETATPENTKGD